jgi:methyltransferase (TIGR00027 family)
MAPPAEISQTARVTAYLRAFARVELFDGVQTGDSLAHHFLPPDWAESLRTPAARAYVKENVMHPGMYPYITARTAHMDEVFCQALRDGIHQVVILGAGYDTRAQRLLPKGSACRIFELDTPATQAHKRACLEKVSDASTHGVRYAPLDLRRTNLKTVLAEIGVEPEGKALFVLEGLIMYLPCEIVTSLLTAIQAWAAPGSRLFMDYLREEVLAGEEPCYGADGLLAKAQDHGEPFQCGFSTQGMEAQVKGLGYRVLSHLLAQDLTTHYLKDIDAGLTGPINECFPNLVLMVAK